MGRPSVIDMRTWGADGRLTEVRIAGSAVPIAQGHITLPA